MKKRVQLRSFTRKGALLMGAALLTATPLCAQTAETIESHTIEAGASEHWTADKVYTLAGAVVVRGTLTIDAYAHHRRRYDRPRPGGFQQVHPRGPRRTDFRRRHSYGSHHL